MIGRTGGVKVSERNLSGLLRELLDGDPDHGIVLFNTDRHVLYANSAARHYLRDGTARSGDALLPEAIERRVEAFLQGLSLQSGPTRLEINYPDDVNRRLRVTCQVILRDHVPFMVLIVRPATPWVEPTVRHLQRTFGLTVREAQIAIEVAKGYTNGEVAANLGLVEKSIKNALVPVYLKCGVRNRVELALRAFGAPRPRPARTR